MKLFNNKIGRPSNEIKKKRKIFVILCTCIIMVALSIGVFLVKSKFNKLNGATSQGLVVSCPTSVNAGSKFQCKINSTKATVRVSKKGLSDHYMQLLKKFNGRFKTPERVVNLMYVRGGRAKIVVEQDGFSPVTKIVNINSNPTIKSIKLNESSISFKVVPGWKNGERDIIDSVSIYKCANNYCQVDGKLKSASYYGNIKKGYEKVAYNDFNKKNTQVYTLTINKKYNRAGKFFIAAKVSNKYRAKNERVIHTKSFYKAYTATSRGGSMYSPIDGSVSFSGANSHNNGLPHDASLSCGTELYSPVKGTISYEVVTRGGKVASYGAVATIRFSNFGSSNDNGYIKFAHLSFFSDIKLSSNEKRSTYPSSCGSGGCSTRTIITRDIQRGEYIGDVGTSGNSTGCHLHAEVWINGTRKNPNIYFSR